MTDHGGPPRERRRHPRALTDLRGTMNVRSTPYAARIINLSMGGALLDLGGAPLDAPVDKGELVSLEIRARGRERPLAAEARVVLWNTAVADSPLLAVQFEPMPDEATEVLEDMMSEAVTELRRRAFLARSRTESD